ncbi:MAG: aldehyde dehydrogenase family protein [Usitatibacter sp.]
MSSNAPAANVFQNYIGGDWTASSDGRTFEQRNPANLEEVTGLWPACTAEDARRAIGAAEAAFPAWRALTVYRRAEYLKKALGLMADRRDAMARVLTLENGKTLAESKTEIDSAIREMEFQINEGLRMGGEQLPSASDGVFAYASRAPLGVVSLISPWNFPFNVPGRKGTPALVSGNTVVFKPASLTPQTGHEFTRLFVDAGLPAGVWNFITGSGGTAGETLTVDPRIKAISFTGSTAVGRRIHERAAKILARTQLEMGGKNPLVVLADADLDAAAQAAVTAAYACAGQWCTSTSRVVVEKPVAKELSERIVARVKAMRIGNGMDAGVNLGPVCGAQQLEDVLRYIDIGRKEGATLACGGRRVTEGALAKGCFIEPTVFTGVQRAMRIAQEEIFGPVLSIMVAEDFDAACDIANDVIFGLSSSIYTRDLAKAHRFAERSQVGMTHVNMHTALKEPQFSFGGVKQSGFGVPEAGRTGIEFFTEHRVVYIKYR